MSGYSSVLYVQHFVFADTTWSLHLRDIPTSLPISALEIGELTDILRSFRSASSSPTIW